MKIEEARLKNDLHTYLTQRMADKDITQDELASLRELRLGIFSTTTEQVRKEKMKGWVQLLENPVTAKINEQHVTFVGDSLPEGMEMTKKGKSKLRYLSTHSI